MRHAIITAGSKGIGREVTERLLQKGCSVTVNYRSDIARIKELMGNENHMKIAYGLDGLIIQN